METGAVERAPTIARASARGETVAFALMVATLCVLPLLMYPYFVMQALCFALFACAFNLLIGYVGLLSFGHAMFLGTGGYVGAYVAKGLGLPPEVSLVAGIAAAAVLGAAVGLLAIRRQGIYFAMTTLALSQMVYFVALQAPFTHGEDGIQAVASGTPLRPLSICQSRWRFTSSCSASFCAGFAVIYRTVNSPCRRSAESHPRKRTPRDLAGLQD